MSTVALDLFPVAAGAEALHVPAARRSGGHLRVLDADERRPAPTVVRITRRGRLALTGTVALVLVLAFASLVSALGPAGAASAVVVEPGMTLSQIAAEQLPELPLDRAIVDIQRANKPSTAEVAAGQQLVIPGR